MIQKTIVCNEKMKRSVMWKKWIDIKFWNIVFRKIFKQIKRQKVFALNLIFSQILKTIETDWHNIFNYANFEILFKFEKTIENIKIITSKSISIINLYEIYVFIKIYKLIFKRFDHNKSINVILKKRNLIWFNKFQTTIKTIKSIILHIFILKRNLFIRIFKKNNCLKIIKSFFHKIKTHYNQIVRFVCMNDKSILNEKFNLIIQTYEITIKRTAFYTFDQNERIERSEKILIRKIKIMQISNYLSKNLWSKIYKIDDYINNQTSKRNLK